MSLSSTGASETTHATRDAIDASSKAYATFRDRGDTPEQVRAILEKILLLSQASLTYETSKANEETLNASLLQSVAGWVKDETLTPEEVLSRTLQAIGTKDSESDAASDAFLQEMLSLDLKEFKDALINERDSLNDDLETAVSVTSTHSNTQAATLKDMLYQQNVLLTMTGDTVSLIKQLRQTLNGRS